MIYLFLIFLLVGAVVFHSLTLFIIVMSIFAICMAIAVWTAE